MFHVANIVRLLTVHFSGVLPCLGSEDGGSDLSVRASLLKHSDGSLELRAD
jgi:hypothetical protein